VSVADWIDTPLLATVARLDEVPLAERAAILAGAKDLATHRRHFDRVTGFRQIEAGGDTPRRSSVDGAAHIACWNVERLRHLDAIEASLSGGGVDVALLSEVDRGMARSGNGDPIVALAGRLGHTYLYAVEYLELDLGDSNEKRTHAGQTNRVGFHGAAVTANTALTRPFLIRLEVRGEWFDGSRHEPRVGGTIALGAAVDIAGVPVIIASVHLESHCTPARRRDDAAQLLRLIDQIAPAAPVILGGDFNTSTASPKDRDDRARWRARLAAEPGRLTRPEPYEPLFELLAGNGYDWFACNLADIPTTRHAEADRPRYKLDWFFTRGLHASAPAIMPALNADGSPSSDHDCLVVTVRPR
jgi:endonuclease/exonuclease/phosphatase family metal-dependent hydrolase